MSVFFILQTVKMSDVNTGGGIYGNFLYYFLQLFSESKIRSEQFKKQKLPLLLELYWKP